MVHVSIFTIWLCWVVCSLLPLAHGNLDGSVVVRDRPFGKGDGRKGFGKGKGFGKRPFGGGGFRGGGGVSPSKRQLQTQTGINGWNRAFNQIRIKHSHPMDKTRLHKHKEPRTRTIIRGMLNRKMHLAPVPQLIL